MLAESKERSLSEIAASLDISDGLLSKWISKSRSEGAEAFRGHGVRTRDEAEFHRLQAENTRLKQEITYPPAKPEVLKYEPTDLKMQHSSQHKRLPNSPSHSYTAPMRSRIRHRGVALLLVIFIIALASIIVVNLAYSTYLGSRVSISTHRAVQAEYLLKSALSVSLVLLNMRSPTDTSKDAWVTFYEGVPIPSEYLGINEPNLKLSLEIRPENVKLSIKKLGDPSFVNDWRPIFTRFFTERGFDDDKDQTDQTGLFPNKHFTAEELTANLIDYQDADTVSDPVAGVESNVPDAKTRFPNTIMASLHELSRVPGFTPRRIHDILPFVTVQGNGELNTNFVAGIKSLETQVLSAIDANIKQTDIEAIQAIALSDQPFSGASDTRLDTYIPPANRKGVDFNPSSKRFQVIAEADYGTSHYFLRAYISHDKNSGNPPEVESLEMY